MVAWGHRLDIASITETGFQKDLLFTVSLSFLEILS